MFARLTAAVVVFRLSIIFCCSALFFNTSVLAANEKTVALVMKALHQSFFLQDGAWCQGLCQPLQKSA